MLCIELCQGYRERNHVGMLCSHSVQEGLCTETQQTTGTLSDSMERGYLAK
jgi:hypothetical protein